MLNIGILGCGSISKHYLKGSIEVFPKYLHVEAVADIDITRAQDAAEKWGIAKALTPEEMLADPAIDCIVNLTVPKAHYDVSMSIINAGKHLYTEKPFALTREDAQSLYDAAKAKGVRIGCAPDTFLSGPNQTVKKLLEEGSLGDVVGASMVSPIRGNEFCRPDAEFFYQKGAGPIWDMGAYYINLMVSLFGPVKAVTAVGRKTWEQRTYEVEARRGDKIDVEIPTHVVGLFEMANGAIVNFTNTFDMYKTAMKHVEITCEHGVITLPDPNHYKGDVNVAVKWDGFNPIEELDGYIGFMRPAGLADMAVSMERGVAHLCSAELALHTTDVMCAWDEAVETQKRVEIKSTCEVPEGMWHRPAIR